MKLADGNWNRIIVNRYENVSECKTLEENYIILEIFEYDVICFIYWFLSINYYINFKQIHYEVTRNLCIILESKEMIK